MTCIVCNTRQIKHRYKKMCKECYKEHSLAYHREYRRKNPEKMGKPSPEKAREYSEAAQLRKKTKDFLAGKLTIYNHCTWPHKTCGRCGEEKYRDSFYNEKGTKDEKSYVCKSCKNKGLNLWRKTSGYDSRGRFEDRVPNWLTESHREEIRRIYNSRKGDQQVDHIVPLRGQTVCGLHVPWNLQILSKEENLEKGNLWWPDMW